MEVGNSGQKRTGPRIKNSKRAFSIESRQCLNTIDGMRCPEESRSAFCTSRRCRREWYYLTDNIAKAVQQANKDPKCTEKTWDQLYELIKVSQSKSAEIESHTYLNDAIAEVGHLNAVAKKSNIIEGLASIGIAEKKDDNPKK